MVQLLMVMWLMGVVGRLMLVGVACRLLIRRCPLIARASYTTPRGHRYNIYSGRGVHSCCWHRCGLLLTLMHKRGVIVAVGVDHSWLTRRHNLIGGNMGRLCRARSLLLGHCNCLLLACGVACCGHCLVTGTDRSNSCLLTCYWWRDAWRTAHDWCGCPAVAGTTAVG